MVFDHEKEHRSRWAAVSSIATKIGCTAQSLNEWVKKAEVDSGTRAGLPTEVVCTPTLEHRKLEFPGYSAGDGLGASPGFCNEIGGLWPMAPCGRSSL
jgi:hypothetical protein